MPAWLERSGERNPLQVGMELRSGDRIHTGTDARVLLHLEEGSEVKLGADAHLDLATLHSPPDPAGVFTGVLNVLEGAFRLTTSALGKTRARNITARVSTVTIGIRGTDVWGKSEPTRDFVVLLEGRIDIQRQGEAAQRMETPMTLFMAPKGSPTLPIGAVNPQDLQRWAQETELRDGSGVMRSDGRWSVHLASFRRSGSAQALLNSVHAAGYAGRIQQVNIAGSRWTRVSIDGFASRADAESVRARLAAQWQLPTSWIEQRR